MEQRVPFGLAPALPAWRELGGSVKVGLGVGLAVLLAAYLGLAIAFVRALPPPAFDLALPAETGPVAVDTPLVLQTIGWGTTVGQIQLTEYQLGDDAEVVAQREVPVRYQPITEGRLPGETRGVLVSPDGGPLLALDARYELVVRGEGKVFSWQGLVKSVPLVVRGAFATPLTPRPQFEGARLLVDEPIAIGWNVPIAGFEYVVRPEARSHSWLSEDGTTAYIALDDFEQGSRYEVEITDAQAASGAPLAAPGTAVFTTPAALRVVGYTPDNGARDVAAGLDPILTFSAPIGNPEAAEDAILVDPPVDGKFRWLAPNRVQFVTDKGFPYSTNIRLTVQAGPDWLRSVDGGYLEQDATLAYRTRVHKRIDVDLTRQSVTLYEDGHAVFSTPASTGARGAETPPGTYTITYKLEKTRMRGVYPDGRPYDVADVPWVLPFMGDYTLHGAPWRQAWGVPLSNGCVSMPTAAAKRVYDWTPTGTQVTIHY
jgi:lipoprotein-anchoring transpeptidase ErfK/SrfK